MDRIEFDVKGELWYQLKHIWLYWSRGVINRMVITSRSFFLQGLHTRHGGQSSTKQQPHHRDELFWPDVRPWGKLTYDVIPGVVSGFYLGIEQFMSIYIYKTKPIWYMCQMLATVIFACKVDTGMTFQNIRPHKKYACFLAPSYPIQKGLPQAFL